MELPLGKEKQTNTLAGAVSRRAGLESQAHGDVEISKTDRKDGIRGTPHDGSVEPSMSLD